MAAIRSLVDLTRRKVHEIRVERTLQLATRVLMQERTADINAAAASMEATAARAAA
ncbi:MAG TPA: hypothetical protein VGC13_22345 [Longimicrobium sp.]|jgi:hypothetical protein|uniref:hypothetical protein n=1 Tax=Longimicrobium sp. TaxID=2029185 RepID=UPI002ED7B112